MTSPSKSTASRINGRKSRGPRTRAGKARVSQNARQHGLAAFHIKSEPAKLAQVAQMVDAICQGDDDGHLRQQATLIAENQLWLTFIRAEKRALLERLRDPNAYALAHTRRLARGRARLRLCRAALPQLLVIEELMERAMAAGLDPEDEPLPPALKAKWPPGWAPVASEAVERNEYELLREGLCDLERLLRYEQRAWARRKRAVRAFLAAKVTKRFQT